MGGNISSVGATKADKDDSDYCQLHLSAVFNEAYVSSILDQLPEYTPSPKSTKGSDIPEGSVKDGDNAHALKFKKLMTILAPTLKLDDRDINAASWSLYKAQADKSAFESNNAKRIRLLLRIYQVALHCGYTP